MPVITAPAAAPRPRPVATSAELDIPDAPSTALARRATPPPSGISARRRRVRLTRCAHHGDDGDRCDRRVTATPAATPMTTEALKYSIPLPVTRFDDETATDAVHMTTPFLDRELAFRMQAISVLQDKALARVVGPAPGRSDSPASAWALRQPSAGGAGGTNLLGPSSTSL
jgi:hypothetical protein